MTVGFGDGLITGTISDGRNSFFETVEYGGTGTIIGIVSGNGVSGSLTMNTESASTTGHFRGTHLWLGWRRYRWRVDRHNHWRWEHQRGVWEFRRQRTTAMMAGRLCLMFGWGRYSSTDQNHQMSAPGPNATQFTMSRDDHAFGVRRQCIDRAQSIFALHNLSRETDEVSLMALNLIEDGK